MKCYNHQDREVVAVCKECGKNLCKSCYDTGAKGICAGCIRHDKEIVEKNKELSKINKSGSFLRSSMLFLILGSFTGSYFATLYLNSLEIRNYSIIIYQLIFISIFCYLGLALNTGMRILENIFKGMRNWGGKLLILWPIYLIFLFYAILIGFFAAIPMLIYHLYKYYKKPQTNARGGHF